MGLEDSFHEVHSHRSATDLINLWSSWQVRMYVAERCRTLWNLAQADRDDIEIARLTTETELAVYVNSLAPQADHEAQTPEAKKTGRIRSTWLNAQLLQSGWSDLDLAGNGGPSYNTTQRYRSGKLSNQDRQVRFKIANALKVAVSMVPE